MTNPTKPIIDGPGEYETRHMGIAIINEFCEPPNVFQWYGSIPALDEEGKNEFWTTDGHYWSSGKECPYDIIGKWTKPTPPDAPSYEELAVSLLSLKTAFQPFFDLPATARGEIHPNDWMQAEQAIDAIPSNLLATHEARIRAEEREACAQSCEFLAKVFQSKADDARLVSKKKEFVAKRVASDSNATAIRARSEGEGDE